MAIPPHAVEVVNHFCKIRLRRLLIAAGLEGNSAVFARQNCPQRVFESHGFCWIERSKASYTVGMPYHATVFKIMIASPRDVAGERTVIREVLAEWNAIHSDTRRLVLLPVAWETHSSPGMGDRPQAIINKQILKDCDLLIGVFWTRIGTATGEYASGTVEEIEEHIKAGKPVMLYFSAAPVHPDSVDPKQYEALKNFKDSCRSRGLLESYVDINDFKSKFYRQLQLKLKQERYFLKHSAPTGDGDATESSIPDVPILSREAQTLLKEAAHDPNGRLLRILSLEGLVIQTNGKGFVEKNNPRSGAIWEGAVADLEAAHLIADRGYKREVFGITREGYEVAELLNP